MLKELIRETEDRMRKAVEVLEADLRAIRTGRASPALVERVMVEYYGTPTPLNQLAVISAPEPQLLTIRPYDPGSLGDIERAILRSELGLTPTNDGRIIRLPIPRLNEERRQELAKLVRQRVEEGKVALRNIRREVLDDSLRKRGSFLRTTSTVARMTFRISLTATPSRWTRLAPASSRRSWKASVISHGSPQINLR